MVCASFLDSFLIGYRPRDKAGRYAPEDPRLYVNTVS